MNQGFMRSFIKIKFQVEGKKEIENPEEHRVEKYIELLRSYGPASYASLTDSNGNYIQVAGGGITCMVELYNEIDKKRSRAFHNKSSPIFSDGTILSFRGGNIPMKSDEWFISSQVVEIFMDFLRGRPFPEYVNWRDAPGF